jgi:UDP-N-acetylmuramate: L-alanyl-gamma-D-glutamyl-meso-diaminopimelate ligase
LGHGGTWTPCGVGNIDYERRVHVHIVAVAGTGMGALAGLLSQLGHRVTGSDTAFYPPMGPALERWGIHCLSGFDPAHLDSKPDLVVIGNVCRRDNPEAVAAFERGLRVTHIAGALRELVLATSSPLVIAGTHGKTTTTALAAFLLDATGRTPGFLIGGIPIDFGVSARPAPGAPHSLPVASGTDRRRPFVIEGDEYDTAYFEKTAKFLHYGAEVAVITSIEHDHIDIYPDFGKYLDAFAQFIATVPETGLIVARAADARVVELVSRHARAPVAWYALQGEPCHGQSPHWLAAPLPGNPNGTSLDVYAGGVYAGRFATQLSGDYNVGNALAALAAAAQGYAVPLGELRAALPRFRGVLRRQQLLGKPGGIAVIDDFAHHPTAVGKTLRGLRDRTRDGKLFAVFEPRSATACRSLHQEAYAGAFEAADAVLLAPLGRANIPAEEQLDIEHLVAELRRSGKDAASFPSVAAIVESLVLRSVSGDVIAVLSNGAFGGIHGLLLDGLTRRHLEPR